MSFGFSVGDFVAVGKLVADIAKSLRETGGAKSEYQELVRELESLQQALHHLDNLHINSPKTQDLASIKYAALSCRRPLEQFLSKIKKYDNGVLRNTAERLKWAYGQKDEIKKLQGYLNVHVGAISILLAEHGLEMMSIASEEGRADQTQIRERLDYTRELMEKINTTVSSQTLAISTTNSMLTRLCQLVPGDFHLSWRSLVGMVAKVCVSTQLIYTVVLEIKSSLALGDMKWTYFQAPLIVEDALGFKFPVPSEYDFGLLDSIIKHRFSEGPGSREVSVGNYEYLNTIDRNKVISAGMRLVPGTSITMAILVSKPESSHQRCPMPRCGSYISNVAQGGGRICSDCKVWFDKSHRSPKELQVLLDVLNQQKIQSITRKRRADCEDTSEDALRKRRKVEQTMTCEAFRNVRWGAEELPPGHISPNIAVELEAKVQASKTVITGLTDCTDWADSESLALGKSSSRPTLTYALNSLDLIKSHRTEYPATYESFLAIAHLREVFWTQPG